MTGTERPHRRPGFRGDFDAGTVAIRAFAGMVRHQRVVKYQLLVTAVMVAAGLWQGFGPLHWIIVARLAGSVVYAEMNNSTHEAGGDAISAEYHPGVGQLKDRAAGTVTVPTLVALICLPFLFALPTGW